MSLFNDKHGRIALAGMALSFGDNEDYCAGAYPWQQATDQATGDQLLALYNKCIQGCSGAGCVSNPGMLADPWTDVGKLARGLPDDSTIAALLKNTTSSLVGGGAKPTTTTGAVKATAVSTLSNPIVLVGLGAIAYLVLKKKKGGRSFGGYSKKHRRERRTRRAAKRS